jgi:hypothetical protein
MKMGIQVSDKEPQFIGTFGNTQQDMQEFQSVMKMVESLNKDLVDSGFDQYQYQLVRRGKKAYVELK